MKAKKLSGCNQSNSENCRDRVWFYPDIFLGKSSPETGRYCLPWNTFQTSTSYRQKQLTCWWTRADTRSKYLLSGYRWPGLVAGLFCLSCRNIFTQPRLVQSSAFSSSETDLVSKLWLDLQWHSTAHCPRIETKGGITGVRAAEEPAVQQSVPHPGLLYERREVSLLQHYRGADLPVSRTVIDKTRLNLLFCPAASLATRARGARGSTWTPGWREPGWVTSSPCVSWASPTILVSNEEFCLVQIKILL